MNKIFILCLIVILIASFSCKKARKNVNDYFPKVNTISAVIQTDGSVIVTGKIESEGESTVEYAGICYSTNSNPLITDNQQIATISGQNFTCTYTNLAYDSTYYFRTWAANDYGYSYGNIISLDSIVATPVMPTCTLAINKVDVNVGGFPGNLSITSVSQPTYSNGYWTFTADTYSGSSYDFKFGSNITTGIYTTNNTQYPGNKQVNVTFWGSVSGTLSSGTNVYVNTISAGVYDITICNAPWVLNSTTFHLNMRFTVPL